jgi:cytochrome c biogenesis protein CcdA/thiol-disulfide isomerase/thioredoxin
MSWLFAVAAFLAGAITILSPCIWPVLPFVLGRAGQPFKTGTLPLLGGMALSFTVAASLAVVAGDRIAAWDTLARGVALIILALSALALLLPSFASWVSRPVLALSERWVGARGAAAPRTHSVTWMHAMGAGMALGLLWAPCAGPVLALVFTAAAIHGPSVETTVLLAVYAVGACTPMAFLLLGGGKLASSFSGALPWFSWVRKTAGVVALTVVVAVAGGWDKTLLARWPGFDAASIEHSLLRGLGLLEAKARTQTAPTPSVADLFQGATGWLNGPAPDAQGLQGKVVLVHFWTYSCINCLRALPYLQAWAQTYGPAGLAVVGIHAPEFAFEKRTANVAQALKDLGVQHPVGMDNNFAVWRSFNNNAWPALYLFDAAGKLRWQHPGEGRYAETESLIRDLLRDSGHALPQAEAAPGIEGVKAPASPGFWISPETYVGHARASGFASGALQKDRFMNYVQPSRLRRDSWALEGGWTVREEYAESGAAGARIAYRFLARDLHLVLGSSHGQPVRFRVWVDGQPPREDHGMDIDAQGQGTVRGQRLYQLIRGHDGVRERLFEIEFLDPGAQAYAFTFG